MAIITEEVGDIFSAPSNSILIRMFLTLIYDLTDNHL